MAPKAPFNGTKGAPASGVFILKLFFQNGLNLKLDLSLALLSCRLKAMTLDPKGAFNPLPLVLSNYVM